MLSRCVRPPVNKEYSLIKRYKPWPNQGLLQSIAFLLLSQVVGGCAATRSCDPKPVVPGVSGEPPKECAVDGCSMAPDFDFRACCDRHDARYWPGGTKAHRKQADIEFRRCIEDHDHPFLAGLYYHGVRVMGTPHLPTPWRWGFGWDYPRGYDYHENGTAGDGEQKE